MAATLPAHPSRVAHEQVEFLFAADKRSGPDFALPRRCDRDQFPGRQGVGASLHGEVRHRAERGDGAERPHRAFAHEDLAASRVLLQPRGQVDDLTGDHELSFVRGAGVGDDLAGGETDAYRRQRPCGDIRLQPVAQRRGGPRRPLRVVLVDGG